MSIKVVTVDKVPDGRAVAHLVRGDSRTQIIRFVIDRYEGGVDLSGLMWCVKIINAAGKRDVYNYGLAEQVENDRLAIDWLVHGVATAAVGDTQCALEGVMETDGPVVWRSGVSIIHVREDLEATQSADVEQLTELQRLILYVRGELEGVIAAENARVAAEQHRANAEAQRVAIEATRQAALAEAVNSATSSQNAAALSASNAENFANAAAAAEDNVESMVGIIAREPTAQQMLAIMDQELLLLKQIVDEGISGGGDLNGFSFGLGENGVLIISYTNPEDDTDTAIATFATNTQAQEIAQALYDTNTLLRTMVAGTRAADETGV